MQISMDVNGKSQNTDVEPRVLLVDFIRDVVGLTGTKVGCDTGQCGACVIQVNGRSMKSCLMLAAQANGSKIETIEGVSNNGQLAALQQRLWERHGLQCGFCTPGLVLSLLDLLQHHPNPDEGEIRSWLDGNLCRCTGYQNIVSAVQDIAQTMQSSDAELAPALS